MSRGRQANRQRWHEFHRDHRVAGREIGDWGLIIIIPCGLAGWVARGYFLFVKKEMTRVNRFENNPLAQAILREGLLIQDRFSAEPIYAKTGKGYLKSVGVSDLAAVKNLRTKKQKSRSKNEQSEMAGSCTLGDGCMAERATLPRKACSSRVKL
jgi:hypothetical protein